MKIRRRKKENYGKARKRRLLACLLVLGVLFGVIYITASLRLRPLILEIAASKAQFIASRAINDSVSDELLSNAAQYTDIIKFEKNSDNQILAINTDIIKINNMKARIINRVSEKLKAADMTVIKIPIGSIIGGDLFYGRGPRISVQLMPLGSASADFVSALESAGINQTRHRIIIEASVNMSMLVPGGSSSITATSQISIAETVLVGSVPNSYTYLEDGNNKGVEKYFNYADSSQP